METAKGLDLNIVHEFKAQLNQLAIMGSGHHVIITKEQINGEDLEPVSSKKGLWYVQIKMHCQEKDAIYLTIHVNKSKFLTQEISKYL
jgi:hypothetical protein